MLPLLALLPVLVASAAAQGDGAISGRVSDAAGRPVAEAQVTLLSRPIARCLESGAEHRIAARTDDSGRFRVALRKGCSYSVWASWADAATEVAEGVAAGEFVELRGVPGTGPVGLALQGADAWPEAPTFTLRALVGSEHIDFAPVGKQEQQWLVPALPPMSSRVVEVLDGRGQVLWAATPVAADGRPTLVLPPPAEYDVAVADAAGAPLTGVDILAHIRNYWYSESECLPFGDRFRALWPVAGVTDAKGQLRLRVPQRSGGRELRLLARKDGFAMSFDGIQDGQPFRNGTLPKEPAPEGAADAPIRIVLRPQEPVKIPLRIDAETPLGEGTVFLTCRVHVRRDGGATGIPFQVTMPVVGGEARFLAPLPEGDPIEGAFTPLASGLRDRLAASHGFAPGEYRLPRPAALAAADAAPQLALADLRVVQVLAADGRPAARTVVSVEGGPKVTKYRLRTDRLGRVLVDVSEGRHVAVLGRSGAGGVTVDRASPASVPLQLQAMVAVTVRVVDEAGAGVAGVTVSAARLVTSDTGTTGLEPKGAAELAMQLLGARTDAEGNCQLLLPPFAAAVQLHVENGSRPVRAGAELDWDPAKAATHRLEVASGR